MASYSPNSGQNPPVARWQRTRVAPPLPVPGATFAPTTPVSGDPFAQFDDPATHQLEEVIRRQLGDLSRPVSDPTSDGIMAFLKQQLGSLSGAAPIAFDLPGDFSAANPLLDDFIGEGRKRIAELNERPFTDAEEAALKTRTRNDELLQRDQGLQRAKERAAARGIADTSGVLQAEESSIDNSYQAADAKNQNDLMLWIAEQIQGRKDKAAGISQSLAAAGEQQAAREQAGRTAAGQMRMQGQIAASSANQSRQGQIMGIAGALADMAAQQRGEARARQGDVLSLSTLLAQLPVQRLQTLMSVLNGTGGGNISDLFGNVVNLNTAQQNAHNNSDSASDSFLEGLSGLASYYAGRGAKK